MLTASAGVAAAQTSCIADTSIASWSICTGAMRVRTFAFGRAVSGSPVPLALELRECSGRGYGSIIVTKVHFSLPTSVELLDRYQAVRSLTESLASVLTAEDQVAQSMPDTSPAKWHRAHTTWFFETFLLKACAPDYLELDPAFAFLFNSYYVAAGPRHTRAERGMITRPGIAEVGAYRRHVDQAMAEMLTQPVTAEVAELVELGCNHEQQHQELLLMDIKHLFSLNPIAPAYAPGAVATKECESTPMGWLRFDGGIVSVGHKGSEFCFDNELPQHDVLLQTFELADRLITCGEWIDFIEAGGYENPTHWLSDGWHTAQKNSWEAPEYWRQVDGQWMIFTLAGLRDINPAEPVSHLSYYEADAYAAWAGARLPTEFEWEHGAATADLPYANDTPSSVHPQPAAAGSDESGLRQMFGELWQWTSSSYSPYPGFRAAPGAVGEYNGKFMVNTWVLRGGCVATPPGHVRASYRNFFYPSTRWHFSGLRLARNI